MGCRFQRYFFHVVDIFSVRFICAEKPRARREQSSGGSVTCDFTPVAAQFTAFDGVIIAASMSS